MNFAVLTLAFVFFCTLLSQGSPIRRFAPQVRNSALRTSGAANRNQGRLPQLPPAALPPVPLGNLSAPAPALLVDRLPGTVLDPIILNACQRHNVRPALVKSIVAAESAFNPRAKSQRGAIGLMQLMPQTAQQFGADPTNPAQNIDAGTRYLRVLLNRYSKHRNCIARAIAAYNAGPTIVDRYHGIPPFRETRDYVIRVLNYFRLYQRDLG
jgi:soluble lytic murein transglycosylase-like protein